MIWLSLPPQTPVIVRQDLSSLCPLLALAEPLFPFTMLSGEPTGHGSVCVVTNVEVLRTEHRRERDGKRMEAVAAASTHANPSCVLIVLSFCCARLGI
jgi:hypothetical protein